MASLTVVQVTVVDRGQSLPALLVGDASGNVCFHRELLASARKFRSTGWGFEHIDRFVRAIRKLIEYYVASGMPVLDEDGLRSLVWEYLAARIYGTGDSDEPRKRALGWRPCRWNTVKHDCRAIADYSDYCAKTYGYLPLIDSAKALHSKDGTSYAALQGLKVIVERTVLGHLRLLRGVVISSPLPSRRQASTSGMGRAVMSTQQAWDVIDAERNPIYKMTWLLGFWGGPRISEQLNMWRCDVLPGDLRQLLFNRDMFRETPLVVLANPWESTYCGILGDQTTSRRVHLAQCFNAHPRPDLRFVQGGRHRALWAGWKGMLETNEARHISQIIWADQEAAREYMGLYKLILDLQFELGIERSHPYLLVNLDRRGSDDLGTPLKLSNIAKAWERAVVRVGLKPYRFGASLHGMRHFYKSYIDELGLKKKVIQLMMHHRSIGSQDIYGGLNERFTRDALALSSRQRMAKLGEANGSAINRYEEADGASGLSVTGA